MLNLGEKKKKKKKKQTSEVVVSRRSSTQASLHVSMSFKLACSCRKMPSQN